MVFSYTFRFRQKYKSPRLAGPEGIHPVCQIPLLMESWNIIFPKKCHFAERSFSQNTRFQVPGLYIENSGYEELRQR